MIAVNFLSIFFICKLVNTNITTTIDLGNQNTPGFFIVTGIKDVPQTMVADTILTLTGTVVPSYTTSQSPITWKVTDDIF